MPIGLNTQAGVAWCVVERRTSVRWGDLKTIEEIAYELYACTSGWAASTVTDTGNPPLGRLLLRVIRHVRHVLGRRR